MFDYSLLDEFQRIRQNRARWVWPQDNLSGGGIPAFVGQVTSSGSMIKVGSFLLVQPNFVLGPEVEGGSGVFSPFGSSTIPVYLVGPGKPSTGDYLVCRFVDNRWVAERTLASTGTGKVGSLPFCFCDPIAATLTMTSADQSCNYRMFQSCTLLFGPTPAGFAPLNLGAHTFLSTQGFPDPLANGAMFNYYLTCQYNQFNLTRIYLESPFGSPFRDGVLYSWLLGGYGNTCDPFHLDNGTSFPGSDLSCNVKIDAA